MEEQADDAANRCAGQAADKNSGNRVANLVVTWVEHRAGGEACRQHPDEGARNGQSYRNWEGARLGTIGDLHLKDVRDRDDRVTTIDGDNEAVSDMPLHESGEFTENAHGLTHAIEVMAHEDVDARSSRRIHMRDLGVGTAKSCRDDSDDQDSEPHHILLDNGGRVCEQFGTFASADGELPMQVSSARSRAAIRHLT